MEISMDIALTVPHRSPSQLMLRRRVDMRSQEIRAQSEAVWSDAMKIVAKSSEYAKLCDRVEELRLQGTEYNLVLDQFAWSKCINCNIESVNLPFGFFCVGCEMCIDDIFTVNTDISDSFAGTFDIDAIVQLYIKKLSDDVKKLYSAQSNLE